MALYCYIPYVPTVNGKPSPVDASFGQVVNTHHHEQRRTAVSMSHCTAYGLKMLKATVDNLEIRGKLVAGSYTFLGGALCPSLPLEIGG